MAPFPPSLKLDNHDIIIQDFKENYTQARFFSSRTRHVKNTTAKFSISDRNISLNVTINMTPMRLSGFVTSSEEENAAEIPALSCTSVAGHVQ